MKYSDSFMVLNFPNIILRPKGDEPLVTRSVSEKRTNEESGVAIRTFKGVPDFPEIVIAKICENTYIMKQKLVISDLISPVSA